MTINAGELAYNGYLFGAITSTPTAHVTEVEGLDLPPVRSSDAPLPGAHGSLPGQDRLDARTVDLTVHVIAADAAALTDTLLDMSVAAAPRDDELPLTFRFSDVLPEMRIYCRPRRRSIPLPQHHAHSNARCLLQLVASDPRIYSETEYATHIGAPTAPGGFSFAFSFPFDFGAAGSGSTAQVTNAGTMPAPWRAVIQGPCTGITLIGPGGMVRWDGTLTVGEILEIDAHPSRRTALINGTASRYGLVSTFTTWFLLPAGTNQISLYTDTNDGSATFFWRDAWWSVT